MNRRHKTYAGVHQRCQAGCPADRCRTHRWSWTFETAPGPAGQRRRLGGGGYRTAKDARDAREKTIQAVRGGTAVLDRTRTFAVWSLEWLAAKVERGELRPSTALSYRLALDNHLLPQIGRVKLPDLTGWDLTRAYAQINRVTSPASVARIHALVSGCLASAHRAGLVAQNVALLAEKPKRTRVRYTPWTPQQLARFLDFAEEHDPRFAVLVDFAAHSGLRRGELLGLKWSDVDLGSGRVSVCRQRTTVAGRVHLTQTKTDAGERVLWIGKGTCSLLRAWRARQAAERLRWGPAYTEGGWVFTWQDGSPVHPDGATKRFLGLVRKSGLPAQRFHDLRHYRASAFLSSGAEMGQVSKLMGHQSLQVTVDIYGHLDEQAHQELAEKADRQTPRRKREAG